jgi:flotillin
MASTMPPMMQVLRDIAGVELPDALIKLGTDGKEPREPAGSLAGGNGAAEPTTGPKT